MPETPHATIVPSPAKAKADERPRCVHCGKFLMPENLANGQCKCRMVEKERPKR